MNVSVQCRQIDRQLDRFLYMIDSWIDFQIERYICRYERDRFLVYRQIYIQKTDRQIMLKCMVVMTIHLYNHPSLIKRSFLVHTVGQNNIGAPKMRNYFQSVEFPIIAIAILDFLIASAKVMSINLPCFFYISSMHLFLLIRAIAFN